MCKVKEFTINNEMGIHARPATQFVQTVTDFESEVNVINLDTGYVANGRSIISMLMLAAQKGHRVQLEINGRDEDELMDRLTGLLENNFNEISEKYFWFL